MRGQHATNTDRASDPRIDALRSNRYQQKKARSLAAALLQSGAQSESVSLCEFSELAARLSHREWISVAMQARVAVPDHPAKVLTIAYLLKAAA